jgi:hypothetical protein
MLKQEDVVFLSSLMLHYHRIIGEEFHCQLYHRLVMGGDRQFFLVPQFDSL